MRSINKIIFMAVMLSCVCYGGNNSFALWDQKSAELFMQNCVLGLKDHDPKGEAVPNAERHCACLLNYLTKNFSREKFALLGDLISSNERKKEKAKAAFKEMQDLGVKGAKFCLEKPQKNGK